MITSKNCIVRLSRYRNALYRLKSMGLIRVISNNLADATGVTALQVRKDFSMSHIRGNKKGGYQIDNLIEKLNQILGKNEVEHVIVAGIGKIGRALVQYRGFKEEGIKIVASFDIDPQKYNEEIEIPVLPLEKMREYIKKNNIKIGIITVPDTSAQQVLNLMACSGIKGVLNFAPIRLRSTPGIIINNVNLVMELEKLIYFVNTGEKTGGNIGEDY
ncbi:MAG: redox-sensing transcriptional repressor Rex [Candidatus Eremiobacterota bacterium]